ncbi:hypothetical protein [Halococcus saccharolyticus]|uniref:hypothetical protein n=1 Tax=Halococcus saccharolyticus TaxID=62319 RepID=UPI000B2EE117|nr:hypothetical protein [Halococcus saccharolyticus]
MSLATLAALPAAPTVGQLGIGSVAQAGSERMGVTFHGDASWPDDPTECER